MELLVVIAIIATLAALSTPAITSALQRAALTTSVNNARQISLALNNYAIDFDGEYVNETNGATIMGGAASLTDAASAFNILTNSGSLTSADESLFYTKELKNDFTGHIEGDGDGTLTDDECGYSYVANLANTSAGPTPLVTTKLVNATGTFATAVWGHKAVIARVNNSVKAERLTGAGGDSAVDGEVQETVSGTDGQNIFNWAPAAATILQ